MRHDLTRLKELNARIKPGSPSLVVPIIPTVSMMEAAADARDVFIPGDRLGDWLLPQDEVADGEVADAALVEAYGPRRAYELQVMSEIWAGCISGLQEWSTKRGMEGSSQMVDSWFHPALDKCPPEGWPECREGVTDEHRRHLRECREGGVFVHDEAWMPHADLAYVLPAPSRCSSIMAMRAGQRDFLMEYYLLGLDDVMDMDRLPFVPDHTIEHRFDDEERHRILAAAAWREAASAVLRLSPEDQQMPPPPRAASVFLTRLAGYARRASCQIPDFHRDAPYSAVEFRAGDAVLTLEAKGPVLAARHEDGRGRSFRMEGLDFRLPCVRQMLLNTVRELESLGGLTLKVPVHAAA